MTEHRVDQQARRRDGLHAAWEAFKKGGLDDAAFQNIIRNSQQDSVAARRIMEIVVSRNFKPRKSWMP